MKKLLFAVVGILMANLAFSQIAKDFTLGFQTDLIKTNNSGYFERAQAGLEFNYYISRQFTATAGGEYWSEEKNEFSAVLGARWYPITEAFLRFRGLIGANELSLGGGWAKPLDKNWKFEALGDFYFSGDIAIRAGVIYVFRRKEKI